MNTKKTHTEIAALREAALEDLMETTDAQVRQEAFEDGEDLDAIATQIRSSMREVAAAALRQRLARAKGQMRPKLSAQTAPVTRPTLEQIKQIVQGIFQTDRTLELAFRNGKKQTDSDWLSLYDDLVDMGAIKPDDHGD